MQQEQNIRSTRTRNKVHRDRQVVQRENRNQDPRINKKIQDERRNEQEYTNQTTVESLQSHIITCQIKTKEERQELLSVIDQQKKVILECRKLQDCRNKNVCESKLQNAELRQGLQSLYTDMQDIQYSMLSTRAACTELQEQCTPIALTLMNCVKHKEGVHNFQTELIHKVKDIKQCFNTLEAKCEGKKQLWIAKVDQERLAKEEMKVVSQEMITRNRSQTEEIKTKRLSLQQKISNLEQRIAEKLAEQESLNSNMKQEKQKAMDTMLKEKKKNEELNAEAEELKNSLTSLESTLCDITNDMGIWKNKVTTLQKKIMDGKEENKIISTDLESMKAKVISLESENQDIESTLLENSEMERNLVSELEQTKQECEMALKTYNSLMDSYSKNQESINVLQAQIQEKELNGETFVSEFRSKIAHLRDQIKIKTSESLNMDAELLQDKDASTKLLTMLQENQAAISVLKLKIESANKEIEESEKNLQKLESEAKDWAENKKTASEKLTETETELYKLQESFSMIIQKDEEFRLQTSRENRELEQELLNSERELQNSAANSDWIIQQTVTCVEECKQSYAQHVKEKEDVLAALKNENNSLTKQVQDVMAQKENMSFETKGEIKDLEDSIKELEIKLVNKRTQNQKLPSSFVSPLQISEDIDALTKKSILKSSGPDRQPSRHVQFTGLSSDSECSLVDAETFAIISAERKMLSQSSAVMKNIPEEPARKFFKYKSHSQM